MADTQNCLKCGIAVPPGSPGNLCPKCLLEAGLGGQSDVSEGLLPTSSSPVGSAPGFIPPTPADLAPLFPQLEILELLGKGGMGAVYKARQPRLDRLVAIKVLPREIAATPGFAERFAREAQSLARLSHPNIVAVYDFGESGNLFYFLMEFVDGVNVRHAIQTHELTPNQALAIVPQICEALQFAHDEGIVHRDIKPENILLDKKGRVKIADFGLAKLLGRAADQTNLTGTNQMMGTWRYMAPEQIEATRDVDHRADIYSLGVVFYEMLTGELPLGRFAPPSKKVRIDVRLDEVVLRALEKEPDRRYQQASELKTGVEQLRQTPAPVAAPPGKQLSMIPRLSRCALWGAIWAPCVFLLGFVLLYFLMYRTDWMTPLGFCVLIAIVLGATAPFGTTILGTVAMGHVRRSKGQLYGLPLAFFDALVFPLLLLDGLILVVVSAVTMAVLMLSGGPTGPLGKLMDVLPAALTLAIGMPIIAWADYRIVRAVWRLATVCEPPPRTDGLTSSAAAGQKKIRVRDLPPNRRRRLLLARVIVCLVFVAIVVGLTLFIPSSNTAYHYVRYQPKSQEFQQLELDYTFHGIDWTFFGNRFNEQPNQWNLDVIFRQKDGLEAAMSVLLPGLKGSYLSTIHSDRPVTVTSVLDQDEFRRWAKEEAGLNIADSQVGKEVDQVYELLKRYKDYPPEDDKVVKQEAQQVLASYNLSEFGGSTNFSSPGLMLTLVLLIYFAALADRWLKCRAMHQALADGVAPADRRLPSFKQIPAFAALDWALSVLGVVIILLGVQYVIDHSELGNDKSGNNKIAKSAATEKKATASSEPAKPAAENVPPKSETSPSPQGNVAEMLGLTELGKLAQETFDKGDLTQAQSLAEDYLKTAAKFPNDVTNYGVAIHDGNALLGRIALAKGDVPAAKKYLLAAGKTPGSPTLDSFGPNFTLASELLARGEKQTVIEYLTECKSFWQLGQEKLDRLVKTIEDGQVPDYYRWPKTKSPPLVGVWLAEDSQFPNKEDKDSVLKNVLDFLPDGTCKISMYTKTTAKYRVADSALITVNSKTGKDDEPQRFEFRGEQLVFQNSNSNDGSNPFRGKELVFNRIAGSKEEHSLVGKWICTAHMEDIGDATMIQAFDSNESGTLTLEMRIPVPASITYQLDGETLNYSPASNPNAKLSANCLVDGDNLTLTNFFMPYDGKSHVYHRDNTLPALFKPTKPADEKATKP